MDRRAWWATVHEFAKELDMTEATEDARTWHVMGQASKACFNEWTWRLGLGEERQLGV